MAVSPDAFGGFQLAWRELDGLGIDPFKDFSRLVFNDFPQDDIVLAVRDGVVDAGTVRTEILEGMEEEGKISLQEFTILNSKVTKGFSFLHSTQLYPEWPFAKASQTSDELAQQVSIALLTMPSGHTAARSGRYAGWTIPLDYQPIHELFRQLSIGPYRQRLTIGTVISLYLPWLFLSIIVLMALIGFTVYVLNLNRKLRYSKYSLEAEIDERERVQYALRLSESALRDLHSITSAQKLDFHEKVHALLTMGCKRFGLPIGILSMVDGETYEILEVVDPSHSITKGDRYPLGQTYCCDTLRSAEPIGFEHAAESDWAVHPAYRQHKLEAYLGIRVIVEDRVFGTLNFASAKKHKYFFSNTDREILKLMAQWVGGEIQSKRAEARMREHESALAHVARISTLGEMATGIAHELNQPIAAIANYANGCIRRLHTGSIGNGELNTVLEQISTQAERSGEIIRRLRGFMRKKQLQRSTVDVNSVVKEAVDFVRFEAQQKNVRLLLELNQPLPTISVDRIQIEQVVLNLIRNAIEAIDDADCKRREVHILTHQAADQGIEVTVQDSGPGFPDEENEHIFQAFFTTKENGTGLGLSISQSIIRAHGGQLSAVNENDGAAFSFSLPLHRSQDDQ